MKRVHIVYARTEGSHCSYHCRTYLDLRKDDTVIVSYQSGDIKLATITDVKEVDNEMIKNWIVRKVDKDEMQKHIEIGKEMAKLDKAMMARYEEFIRSEGFEELAEKDEEMAELLAKYKGLQDEV